MQNFNQHILNLTRAVRFLAGSYFTWLALPLSHSYRYASLSRAVTGKSISHPKFRTLVQYVGKLNL